MTTATKERPILFSGPMVRAILAGRKTQTRRVLNPQPKWVPYQHEEARKDSGFWGWQRTPNQFVDSSSGDFRSYSPYGQPGDRLWVRETWVLGRASFQERTDTPLAPAQRGGARAPVIFRANEIHNDEEFKWKPSIFMPRWASRITIEVTGIRVQRVQEITAKGACEEGIFDDGKYQIEAPLPYPVATFKHLWDSINSKRGFGWEMNPWVWVVEFRKVAD